MDSKIDMVIDFNNIAYRSMFICTYSSEYGINDFSTERECAVLVRKIVIDICNVVRLFKPDRVFVACDSKSPWRKNVLPNYKENREKDESKDWDMIYKSFDKLKNILSSKGFCVIDIPESEADDVAGMCKRKFFDNGNDDIILVSADKDWTQLLSFSPEDNRFCICYNPIPSRARGKNGKRIISANEGFIEWFEKKNVTDIFFTNYSRSKESIRAAMSENGDIIIENINPDLVLSDKIMCGDDGDNVPAFWSYYKNGRKVRVTPTKSAIVFESIGSCNISRILESCSDGSLKTAMESAMKTKVDDIDFNERLIRQRMLVELNPDLFPENIVEGFDKAISSESVGSLSTRDLKMTDILSGTEYLNDYSFGKPKVSSIFNDIVDTMIELDKHANANHL